MQNKFCQNCKQWALHEQDNYCGYCGHLIINISLSTNQVKIISEIAPNHKISVKNTGQKRHRIEIRPVDEQPAFIEYSPTNFYLEARGTMDITFSFLNDHIPNGFLEKEYHFEIELDGNTKKIIPITVIAKTGPVPDVTKQINFGQIHKNQKKKSAIFVKNLGATPFILTRVTSTRPNLKFSQLHENKKYQVKTNKSVKIHVQWNPVANIDTSDCGKYQIMYKVHNKIRSIDIPVYAKILIRSLTTDLQDNKLIIAQALSKRTYTEKILLMNDGNVDIKIISIESEESRVTLENIKSPITLVSKDSTKKKSSFHYEVYPVYVTITPKSMNLESDHYSDTIVIYTNTDYKLTIPVEVNVIKTKVLTSYIGLDFGTTNSVISIYDKSKHVTDLVEIENPLGEKTSLIPSVLVFEKNSSSCKIGFEAESLANVHPESTVRSIKRIMGYKREHIFNDKRYSPAQIAGIIINKLKEMCENYFITTKNEFYDIKYAIVTVPANFYDLQIRDILEACKIANLETDVPPPNFITENVIGGIILDEPSAAALYFLNLFHDIKNDFFYEIEQGHIKYMLIFDYGGGTLDVSVIHLKYNSEYGIGISVLANKGNNTIGGDQIDLIIMNQMLALCQVDYPDFDSSLISDYFNQLNNRKQNEQWSDSLFADILRIRNEWKLQAKYCKKSLSINNEVQFKIEKLNIISINEGEIIINESDFQTTITKSNFENWINSVLSECEQVIHKAIDLANLEKEDISHVIHTGRSSLIPAVQQLIKGIFQHITNDGDIIIYEEYLKKCVAQGAALYGEQRESLQAVGKGVYLISEGRKLPHGYGTHKAVFNKLYYDPIIPIGASYPVEKSKSYSPEECPQKLLKLSFYQNEGESTQISNNSEITKIGEIEIDPMEDGIPGADVELIIDANRVLQIKADGKDVPIDPERIEEEQEVWN